jgi:hypothetical protein
VLVVARDLADLLDETPVHVNLLVIAMVDGEGEGPRAVLACGV